jgi:hypothetical protein
MKIGIILLVLCLSSPLFANAFTKEDFYRKIGQIESGNNPNAPAGDNGQSIGMYQIKKAYFIDAWGNTDRYNELSSADKGSLLGRQTIDKYMTRYGKGHWKDNMTQEDMEFLARIHNGGPSANEPERLKYTEDYIKKFRNV